MPSSTLTDGAKLLEEIVGLIRQYVVLSDSGAYVAAAWVVHTHAIDAADHTPYLAIHSVTKRCGKSRLLETLEMLAANSWLTGSTTAAALIRRIEADSPTLLYDEADANFSGDRERSETVRGILNNGFRRGGVHSMCVPTPSGGYEVQNFKVFGPKAIAGIGRLSDTVLDRSIPIQLSRKERSEEISRFRRREVEAAAEPVRERIMAWVAENLQALADAKPDLPDDLDDRGQDIAEPLLAIADLAAGPWPSQLRDAIIECRKIDDSDDGDVAILLLSDIRAAFGSRDFLSSQDLIKEITDDESSPWCEWRRGEPITPVGVAKRLKPFGIRPQKYQKDGYRARGYFRRQFEDTFARYLADDDGTADPDFAPDAIEVSREMRSFIHPRYRTWKDANPFLEKSEAMKHPIVEENPFSRTSEQSVENEQPVVDENPFSRKNEQQVVDEQAAVDSNPFLTKG